MQDVRDVARSSSATEQFGTLLFRLGTEKLPGQLKAGTHRELLIIIDVQIDKKESYLHPLKAYCKHIQWMLCQTVAPHNPTAEADGVTNKGHFGPATPTRLGDQQNRSK